MQKLLVAGLITGTLVISTFQPKILIVAGAFIALALIDFAIFGNPKE